MCVFGVCNCVGVFGVYEYVVCLVCVSVGGTCQDYVTPSW